ncbi:SDR family NAD(P)-dependent oxidoreductase [Nesterenkonia lutea]|uniref:NAD(P)-dependent dehydrogenase (Short-subunit alcohol dehydrogenase family) n=1 Tax=Nesterenkonia lutea TaxID=272919 RepID=A0ABR9JFC9_9MICC|nr:SDR family NAD(P)-dependent oxidoreductase [Nesterenkonia lutea]MBE1524631.1 NAD(P)-dependent dehydrogenase (short-subunit alcohol dehydrogenase family) [Nesterenkonia lutea]
MSTKWTTADLPDLTGKTIVVTGATAGLGEVTTRELARVGAHVVIAVRNEQKAADIVRGIGPTKGRIEVRHLDVADLASVRQFGRSWSEPVDVLINNAGIMQVPLTYTPDGLELQIATNYFGPFALTSALLPHITDRVVSLSSQLHRIGRARVDDLNWKTRKYDDLAAYADSKLAVVLFSNELQRRLKAANSHLRSITAHPGIAKTNLASHAGGLTGRINHLGPMLNTVEQGALPTLYAATQNIPGGSYVGPDGPASIKGHPKIRRPSRTARNENVARDLWDETNRVVGDDLAFTI